MRWEVRSGLQGSQGKQGKLWRLDLEERVQEACANRRLDRSRRTPGLAGKHS